jgi:hypothetical protein
MTKTHTLLFLAAFSGSAFSVPAYADDAVPEAVIALRHVAVPEPRNGDIRLNTAKRATAETAIVRAPGSSAPGPITGIVTGASGSPVLNLEQQGISAEARAAAQLSGVVQILPKATPSAGAEAASPAPEAGPVQGGTPPPPVFQTMKQAAEATTTDSAPLPSMKMEAPVVEEPSIYDQAVVLYHKAVAVTRAYPLALPGFAAFLVLVFLFKRLSSKRRRDDSEQ